jgi:tetratricopeptide (TPR) repeat protein
VTHEADGTRPLSASTAAVDVLAAVRFLRATVSPRALSPSVRLALFTAALEYGEQGDRLAEELDELTQDLEASSLPELRRHARVLLADVDAAPSAIPSAAPGAIPSAASGDATATSGGARDADDLDGHGTSALPAPPTAWLDALARRFAARAEIDDEGWRELLSGAGRLTAERWAQVLEAATLSRPRASVLELVIQRLDAPEAAPTEELVLRCLALQPGVDLIMELPRIAAGPSEWFSRLDDDRVAALMAATDRAVAWLGSSWAVRDIRRTLAAGRLAALDPTGDTSRSARARSELARVLRDDLALADDEGELERPMALRVALLDATVGDASTLHEVLAWARTHETPPPVRAALLDALDAALDSGTPERESFDLDLARVELLHDAAPDAVRLGDALTALFVRHGAVPNTTERRTALDHVLQAVAAANPGALRRALADALATADAERRSSLASALLQRAIDDGDPASLYRAIEAGAPLETRLERARAAELARGDAALRDALRWRVLRALHHEADLESLRGAIDELVRLTDAFDRAGGGGGEGEASGASGRTLAPDEAGATSWFARDAAREISPWLGDAVAKAQGPRRAALGQAILDELVEARGLDVSLVATCTLAVASASAQEQPSPWRAWPDEVATWLGEPFVDELVRAGAHELARRFSEHMASTGTAADVATWLSRAAALTADDAAALATIEIALRAAPGDERLLRMQEAALERALTGTRDEAERRRLRARLAQLRPDDAVLASKLVDDLLVEGREDDALARAIRLRDALLDERSPDLPLERSGGEREGLATTSTPGDLVIDGAMLDLPALIDVSSTIARIHAGHERYEAAFVALAPFFPAQTIAESTPTAGPADEGATRPHLEIRVPPGVASLALGIARQLADPAASIRVLESLVVTASSGPALALRDELATALERAKQHLRAAREWLTCARSSPPAHEDRRRRALRAFQLSHGARDQVARSDAEEAIAFEAALLLWETGPGALATDDVTAIATCLWSHDRGDLAIAFVGQALRARPDDDALLTAHRELCAVMTRPIDWYDALAGAVKVALPGARRDGLSLELAYVGVELEDPTRTLDALASITGPLESSPEVLDLRDWAMRRLGRGDDEIQAILAAWPHDVTDAVEGTAAGLSAREVHDHESLAPDLRRAARILDGNWLALVARVLDHAVTRTPVIARRLRVALVHWLTHDDPGELVATETRVAAVLAALQRIADDDGLALRELADAVRSVAGDAEAADISAFLAVAQRHDALDPPPPSSLREALLASALARFPEAPSIVDALLVGLGGQSVDATAPARAEARGGASPGDVDRPDRPLEASPRAAPPVPAATVDAALARMLPTVGIRPRLTARTWIGVSTRLDRREGSALLLRRGVAWAVDEPEAYDAIVDALAERSAWPELIAALDALATSDDAPTHRRVAAYKRLAHVRLDVLGDDDGVVRELEAALALAPEDPDLLLPLLDHHYARRDLGPALELSRRVMTHVPMGDAAFVALGLRTADAALAWGDPKLAEIVLESVLARCSSERRVKARLAELRSETASPEHRVRMLAAVASRQTGVARRDALEERARLLLSPLGRIDEAITELELLLADGGLRADLHDLLATLYGQRGRWSELADLLEREYPRKQGRERAMILRKLANVYGDRLYDLPRAEQALRLALENAAADSDGRRLRDDLLFDMVRVLELQGRYGELSNTLELELREELSPEGAPADVSSTQSGGPTDGPPALAEGRIRLLEQLARVLRDYVEDEARTARVYERLRQLDRLPDDGLAVLARWYRAERRFDELVRILELRSAALAASGDLERKAEIDRRIGDLLEGPLRRPRDAARWYLDAYLSSPEENAAAGNKARVLLAGTDAIENVRKLLLQRIAELPARCHPAAHTLLGDLLAPQESFESEAEQHYRAALEGDPDSGPAWEGLGRLLARQGRLEAAADPLLRAATNDRLHAERAADVAAVAARVLFELGRITEAERVLKHALMRAPDAQRALLELARLYSRTRRADAEADALDRLSDLPLSSMLRAEVAYRRAMLLEADFERAPNGVAGEQAKAWLLEAVGADAMHAQARQTLLGLANARSEWSIVAHMHFLAIRELPPGPSRALAHLDLAEVYLDRLGDAESALRNLASALTSPTGDLVAERRAQVLAQRFPDPGRAASHVGRVAVEDAELPPGRRVKLLLLAAELALRGDDPSLAEPFVERALAIEGATDDDRDSARRLRSTLTREDVELRRQKNALLKLLEAEEHPGERLHLLVRLREIGGALGDGDLVSSVNGDLQVLAEAMFDQDGEREAAFLALRELLGERADYPRLVDLHERMAAACADDVEAARMLVEAARVAWSGLRDPVRATRLVLRALLAAPDLMEAAALLSELGRSEDATLDALVVDELERIPTNRLGEDLVVRLAMAALRRDREDLAESTLRRALASTPPERRGALLDALDTIVAGRGDLDARVEVLQQRIRHARVHAHARVPDIAFELARAQKASGALDAARHTVTEALALAPNHLELARLDAALLELAEDWPGLAAALQRLAELSTSEDERAAWITRTAKVHLAHPTSTEGGLQRVRELLERARKASIQAREARALLIPLSFAAGDWPLVLELTVELRAVHGDDDEALIFGALVEALVAGRRTIARAVGARHERQVRMRMMWPAAARLLDVVAIDGPIERLDAILGAIGALVGSTDEALAELSAFVAATPSRAGTALALARLHEAIGKSELARSWYQLVAFLAPSGPVPGLADRLAPPELPRDPLHVEGWTPLGWRGPLRETLIELRGAFASMRLEGGTSRPPKTTEEVALLHACDQEVDRWRGPLELELHLALTDDAIHAGIGARNLLPPTLVLSPDFALLPRGERTFRLAVQSVALASGLGVAVDTHPVDLTDMLDALALLCGIELDPPNPTATSILDALASRGVRPTSLTPDLRRALRDELGHWRSTPNALAQLVATIRRAFLAVALRMSGRLDGALMTLARDLGHIDDDGRIDVAATLAADDAAWLLRELGLLA